MAVIAFVGLGRMGRLMTAQLVTAGHDVRGFDVDPAAVVEGVARCASAREAATGAEIAITMLPSPATVRSATLGADGLADGLAPGSLCIDMSTSPPGLARELAAALAERGIDALDAPVSGGTIGAEAGTLTIMVGGSAAAAERARPLLEALGTAVRVGDHGLGQAAKLCNNLCAGVTMAAIAQAVGLARREGIDPAVLYELMSKSTGDSRVLRTRFPAAVNANVPAANGFAPMFTVDLMEKDLALAEQLADEHGLESEPLAAALALYRRAQGEGHGSLDYSAIALVVGATPAPIEALIEQLREELDVQRATVRVDVPDAVFPVRYEVLAGGAGSLRADTTDMARQPVPRVLAEHGGQVVQEDAAAAFAGDEEFHAMRARFGGMRAQIVTGCYRYGDLVALLSVHDLRAPRSFSAAERARCREVAAAIAGMLDGPA
jgi:3-hydroxyisobutyrate dehydrogenase